MSSSALLRTQVEARLADRVAVPFGTPLIVEKPVLPTGIPVVDAAIGGIPCGGITEIVGSAWCSAGRKSLEIQLLARATRERYCVLVDATDSFDPKSAELAGTDLRRLLWVRCGGREMKALEQAFKAADLLLQGSGGFGLIVVDLAGIHEKLVRKVPLSTWFRFRRVVEKLSTSLIFVTPSPVAGTCASLTLHLRASQIRWSHTATESPAHSRLATSLDFQVQVDARRSFKKPSQSVCGFSAQRQWA